MSKVHDAIRAREEAKRPKPVEEPKPKRQKSASVPHDPAGQPETPEESDGGSDA